jgi:hypothetical protein
VQFPLVNSALVYSAFSFIQCFCVGTNQANALNSSIHNSAFIIIRPKTVGSKVTELTNGNCRDINLVRVQVLLCCHGNQQHEADLPVDACTSESSRAASRMVRLIACPTSCYMTLPHLSHLMWQTTWCRFETLLLSARPICQEVKCVLALTAVSQVTVQVSVTLPALICMLMSKANRSKACRLSSNPVTVLKYTAYPQYNNRLGGQYSCRSTELSFLQYITTLGT